MDSRLKDSLARFDPDPSGLLDALRREMSDEDLRTIGEADYHTDADAHFNALVEIRQTGKVPCPLPWEPKEVCELVRWDHPEVFRPKDTVNPSPETITHHRQRAFACAVLLRFAIDDREGYSMGENQTAAVAISSALVLGKPMTALTGRCLAALALAMEVPEERLLLALGVIVCAMATWATERSPELSNDIGELAEALIQETDRLHKEPDGLPRSEQWMFGLWHHDLRDAMWKSLVKHVVLPGAPLLEEEDRERVMLLAAALL